MNKGLSALLGPRSTRQFQELHAELQRLKFASPSRTRTVEQDSATGPNSQVKLSLLSGLTHTSLACRCMGVAQKEVEVALNVINIERSEGVQ